MKTLCMCRACQEARQKREEKQARKLWLGILASSKMMHFEKLALHEEVAIKGFSMALDASGELPESVAGRIPPERRRLSFCAGHWYRGTELIPGTVRMCGSEGRKRARKRARKTTRWIRLGRSVWPSRGGGAVGGSFGGLGDVGVTQRLQRIRV